LDDLAERLHLDDVGGLLFFLDGRGACGSRAGFRGLAVLALSRTGRDAPDIGLGWLLLRCRCRCLTPRERRPGEQGTAHRNDAGCPPPRVTEWFAQQASAP